MPDEVDHVPDTGPGALPFAQGCHRRAASGSDAAHSHDQREHHRECHDARAGEQVSDTVQLGQSGVAIVLPEGDWRISGLVRPRQAGAPYALAVLTKSDGQVLAGTVWVRAVGEVRFETSAMWCSDGGVRQHVEPIVGASGIGCWWVRVWTTALAPEDLQPYWRQAFSHLRREGTPLPRALLAVGYHLVGAGRTLTVEYSFNASQVTVAEVKEWGQAWQDEVRAVFADSSPPSPPRLP